MKIIVLDFEQGEVLVFNYDNNVWEDAEDFLREVDLNPNNCQWMIMNELKITIK